MRKHVNYRVRVFLVHTGLCPPHLGKPRKAQPARPLRSHRSAEQEGDEL